jgi:pimeloyl-ACP methyl ester carboxylesterase
LLALFSIAQAAEQRLLIAPRLTDERLAAGEPPHLVFYTAGQAGAPLLVWLPGTGGQPATGPGLFFETALQQGYRVLALSYLNSPAVSQVCVGATLNAVPACAGRLRQHRVWGEPQTRLVEDRPEDAIVPRLTHLLQHLARSDAAGQWTQYLDGDEPRWGRVVLAGQSQGGGMAAYIAQTRPVAAVIIFSGGWDRQAGGDIAQWYGRPSVTPPQRWHATLHTLEAQRPAMAQIYRRLGIPDAQTHLLTEPVKGRQAHGEGIANPVYQPLWLQMLQLQP